MITWEYIVLLLLRMNGIMLPDHVMLILIAPKGRIGRVKRIQFAGNLYINLIMVIPSCVQVYF